MKQWKPTRKGNTETPIQSDILTWLNYQPGCLAFRLSNHAVPVIKFVRGGGRLQGWRKDKWKMLGLADICCFKKSNQVIFIEVKTPIADLSDDQRRFKAMCEEYGVKYLVARRIEDLEGQI